MYRSLHLFIYSRWSALLHLEYWRILFFFIWSQILWRFINLLSRRQ